MNKISEEIRKRNVSLEVNCFCLDVMRNVLLIFGGVLFFLGHTFSAILYVLFSGIFDIFSSETYAKIKINKLILKGEIKKC